MSVAIWWIRRDIRLSDNKALHSAAALGEVIPLFISDPKFSNASQNRTAFMYRNLESLNSSMNGALVYKLGNPLEQVIELAKQTGATSVHVASDFAPYGRKRDAEVKKACEAIGVTFVEADSPYVIAPGTVVKDDLTPLKVFTPFFKRWLNIEWSNAIEVPVRFADATKHSVGAPLIPAPTIDLPAVGEQAVLDRWDSWAETSLASYKEDRNLPHVDGTSRLSPYLRFGIVHPRQLLSRLGSNQGADIFRSEIAWRDFYADVMFHRPDTASENFQTKMNVLPVDTDAQALKRFQLFCSGNTGFPIVDAGVRQMLATGWMHNRVRMIVASFLVKDLHVPWQWGAKFFMQHLLDGDISSNSHGWQWTAGTGTDASPFFRVFNPISQGQKFDPNGEYVRQWIPELRETDPKSIHEPWSLGLLAPSQYPEPMVDHALERLEALSRYKTVSGK